MIQNIADANPTRREAELRRRAPQTTPFYCCIGIGFAVLLRTLVGGNLVASSKPAAFFFALCLGGLAVAAGWRPTFPQLRGVGIGIGGAGVLVAFSLMRLGSVVWANQVGRPEWLVWSLLVALIATSEEVALRGVLFDSMRKRHGDSAAVLVSAAVFALMHVPLYGFAALWLDLAVGLFLGALRLIAGLSAAVTAHLVADLAAGALL